MGIGRPIEERPFALHFKDESLTQQHAKDSCDINKIMERYLRKGVIDHVNRRQPEYGEVIAGDYRVWMDKLNAVQEMFMELPAEIRKRFENKPEEFLAYVQDPSNAGELEKLGMATPRPVGDAPPGAPVEKLSGDPKPAEPPATPPAKAE